MKSLRFEVAGFLALPAAVFLGCSSSDPIWIASDPLGAEARDNAEQRAALEALASVQPVSYKDVCAERHHGAGCHAKVVTDENGNVIVDAAPTRGLFPADLRDAYKLPASGGKGRLVAIVDGFDSPNAETDMNTYRAQFGIPPCTTANGCFQKVNSDGMPGPLPPSDPSWNTETSVDLDMVSATCPDCRILLVIAKTGYAADLGPAVVTAAKLGAFVISNSYAQPEDEANSISVEPDYNQPGVLILAGSGDNGFDMSTSDDGTVKNQLANPANVATVVAVGGTTLTKAPGTTRGWTEAVWSGTGGGCSSHIAKPAYQTDTGCTKRIAADVSAVGDPATGVAFYEGGWMVIGGTSISTPIVSGIMAVLGVNDIGWMYAHKGAFFDVTMGANGRCGNYQCTAGVGYDGPSGIGTPNGAAIASAGPSSDAGSIDAATRDGGSVGAGGATAGAGGSTGQGGSAGQGGAATGGAGGSTGGPPGAGGSMGGTTTGMSGASGGPTSSTSGSPGATTGGPAVPQASQAGGCSCEIGRGSRDRSQTMILFALAALVAGRRPRVRARRRPS
jgi:hypothetical protein